MCVLLRGEIVCVCKTRVENWMGAVDSPKRLFSRAVKSARRIEKIDRAPKKKIIEKKD